MLRARIRYFNVDRDITSLLITSAAPQEGKSTVAWHLARVAAMSRGTSVVLVETDFRRPSLARAHGLRPMPGLAEALTHGIEMNRVVQSVDIETPRDGITAELDVVVAGAPPPNPSELIESQKMLEFLHQLKRHYDLVVVDTPPTSIVPDVFPLVRQVSGVIVVASIGETTRDRAHHLRAQLEQLNAHTLGVIANRTKRKSGGEYGYGYYGRVESDVQPEDGQSATSLEPLVPAAVSDMRVGESNSHDMSVSASPPTPARAGTDLGPEEAPSGGRRTVTRRRRWPRAK